MATHQPLPPYEISALAVQRKQEREEAAANRAEKLQKKKYAGAALPPRPAAAAAGLDSSSVAARRLAAKRGGGGLDGFGVAPPPPSSSSGSSNGIEAFADFASFDAGAGVGAHHVIDNSSSSSSTYLFDAAPESSSFDAAPHVFTSSSVAAVSQSGPATDFFSMHPDDAFVAKSASSVSSSTFTADFGTASSASAPASAAPAPARLSSFNAFGEQSPARASFGADSFDAFGSFGALAASTPASSSFAAFDAEPETSSLSLSLALAPASAPASRSTSLERTSFSGFPVAAAAAAAPASAVKKSSAHSLFGSVDDDVVPVEDEPHHAAPASALSFDAFGPSSSAAMQPSMSTDFDAFSHFDMAPAASAASASSSVPSSTAHAHLISAPKEAAVQTDLSLLHHHHHPQAMASFMHSDLLSLSVGMNASSSSAAAVPPAAAAPPKDSRQSIANVLNMFDSPQRPATVSAAPDVSRIASDPHRFDALDRLAEFESNRSVFGGRRSSAYGAASMSMSGLNMGSGQSQRMFPSDVHGSSSIDKFSSLTYAR